MTTTSSIMSTSSSSATASQSDTSGMAMGTKIGLGVGIPLGVLAICGITALVWLQRRRSKRSPEIVTMKPIDSPIMVQPQYQNTIPQYYDPAKKPVSQESTQYEMPAGNKFVAELPANESRGSSG